MFECVSDEKWRAMSDADKKAAIERETDMVLYQLTMVQAGLAVRWAGLVYSLPLCHDAYGENI